MYFHNPVSALNMLGVALTLGGVSLYERSMRATPQSSGNVEANQQPQPEKLLRLATISDEDASLIGVPVT
jgi:hypothetical protein